MSTEATPLAFRGEGSVDIGGKTFKLQATFEALMAIEERMKTDLISLLATIGSVRIPLKVVAVAFYEMHKAAGGELTFNECGQLLVNAGYVRSASPILNILGAAVMAGKDEVDSSPLPGAQAAAV